MNHLDVYDPRARALQLRQTGKSITTESGDPHRVGVYVLAAPPPR